MSNFWQFRNISETDGELVLYGEIKSRKSWWDESGEGIFAKQFTSDLASLGAVKNITVRINSNGGDVFAAVSIYTQLKSHAAKVTAIIEGIAASAATIILMGADVIKAPGAAQVMTHDPLVGLMGYYNVTELAKMSNILVSIKESILNAYANKTGRDRKELSKMMEKETWMSADEAKAQGFVDEIMFEESVEASFTNDNRFMVVNSIAHDMSRFDTRPIIAIKQATPPIIPVIPLIENKIEGIDEELEIKNIEELRAKYPELCNQIATAASTAERERIKSIDDISATVADDLVAKAKYDTPITAEALAFQALKADAGKGLKHMASRETELQANADVAPGTQTDVEAKAAEVAASVDLIAASANQGRGRMEAK